MISSLRSGLTPAQIYNTGRAGVLLPSRTKRGRRDQDSRRPAPGGGCCRWIRSGGCSTRACFRYTAVSRTVAAELNSAIRFASLRPATSPQPSSQPLQSTALPPTFRRGAGHRPQVEQLLCEVGRILGRNEKGDPFERGKTGTGNGFIAGMVAMMRNSQNSQAQRAIYFGHTDETIYLPRIVRAEACRVGGDRTTEGHSVPAGGSAHRIRIARDHPPTG